MAKPPRRSKPSKLLRPTGGARAPLVAGEARPRPAGQRPQDPFAMGSDLTNFEPDLAIRPLAEHLQTNNKLLSIIADAAQIHRLLQTIAKLGTPRTITVNGLDQNPVELIPPAKQKRGYLITHLGFGATRPIPAEEVFSIQNLAGTVTSAEVDVGPWEDVHVFMDLTNVTPGATLTVNFQTQMSTTGKWANASTNIFAGAATGTLYALQNRTGVARRVRLQAVAAAGSPMSIQAELNPKRLFALGGSLLGNLTTVFFGTGPDVNASFGHPLFPHGRLIVYLEENASLFALTGNTESPSETVDVRIMELQ